MYFDKDILTQIRNILHIRMGTWDELCILCGVAPSGGCSNLAARYGLDKEAKTIADEIKPGDEETLKIVQAMLEATFSEESENEGPSYRHSWMAEGLGYDQYNEMLNVAVGYFNEAGECDTRDGRIPDGKRVQVRVVDNVNGGDFDEVVHRVDGEEKRTNDLSICSVGYDHNPNFALCEPCYHYLEAWLARDQLPPRSCGFPSDPVPLSFASELYEIVNSQEKRRAEGSGLLPAIDYAGIEDTLEQWQDYFTPARRGVKHLREAIDAGLRGADLIPALLKDCRAYMFMRPNMYPEPPKIDRTPTFTLYHPSRNAIMPAIGNLPNELLLPILHDLPLPSLLALASTCRSLRAFILESSFLDRILKESITRGSLRWLMPVEPVLREHKRAYDTLRLWFAEDHRPEPSPEEPEPTEEDSASEAGDEDEDGERDAVEADAEAPKQRAVEHKPIPPVKPLVMSPHFPRLAFVRECLTSDSMRNRRRLWGQVAQLQALWRDYRLHGWKVNRFYPSSEMRRDPQEQNQ